MPAISDTSPLLGLAAIGQLELLHEQFGAVFIPFAVLAELKLESGFRGAAILTQALSDGWLEAKPIKNVPLVRALSNELHLGEAEALALASDLGMEMIVIDERDGRAHARDMGLKTVGVLGILLRAKKQGRIKSLTGAMDDLRREIGFFVADELYQMIVKEAGEG
jgi:predicted nucleic acid-binding protein